MRRRLASSNVLAVLLSALLSAVLPGPARAQPAGPPGTAPEAPPEAFAVPGAEPVSLSLEDCLRQALENNLDIAVRRYDPLRGAESVVQNESAFDPVLTGSASAEQSQQRQIFFRVPDLTDQTHTYTASFLDPLVTGGSYSVDLYATDTLSKTGGIESDNSYFTSWKFGFKQPLLRNLGPDTNRWQILVARNNRGVSEAQYRQTVIDTLAAAEKAYWDLDFALMQLRTRRASLQLAQDFLGQNKIKVRVGTLAPIEITQAEAEVADREETVILAESAVRTAEDQLRRILNVPRESPLWGRPIQPTDAPPAEEISQSVEEAASAAAANRPDLEQARLALRSRETEQAYRRNQKRWALDFQGSYGTLGFAQTEFDITTGTILSHGSYGDARQDMQDRTKTNWVAGLNLTVPLGNRQAVASYTNAEYALSQARYDLQRLEQAALVEVRNAVRNIDTNLKRYRAAQVNVRLQREKLDAEQKKFDNGMSTSFQVLQYQTDLASAKTRENQAIIDYNKSLAELERVKGTLLAAKKMVLPGATGGSASGPPAGAR